MNQETTRIANPIYDGAFKYLLDDNRIARLFLSTLIGEEITELTFRPTEHHTDIEQRSVTVFRMDFSARIVSPGGEEKLVIIEIQKAKFATDIMRFRKYLGQQYVSKENSYFAGGQQRAMPILSIYLLGHSMEHTKVPVIRVVRQDLDVVAGERIDSREEFIESLTHDSIIVQIPHLSQRRQTDIECLLGVFDQTQIDPRDAHTLSIREEDYPPKFQGIIRRLLKAVSEPKVRETMEVEDEYLEYLESLERAVGEKDAALVEMSEVVAQTKSALKHQDEMLEDAIRLFIEMGLSEQEARKKLFKK